MKEERLTECNDRKTTKCSPSQSPDGKLHISKRLFDKYDIVFPDDNATFKCVASNSLGTATKTFRINILGKLLYRYIDDLSKLINTLR